MGLGKCVHYNWGMLHVYQPGITSDAEFLSQQLFHLIPEVCFGSILYLVQSFNFETLSTHYQTQNRKIKIEPRIYKIEPKHFYLLIKIKFKPKAYIHIAC